MRERINNGAETLALFMFAEMKRGWAGASDPHPDTMIVCLHNRKILKKRDLVSDSHSSVERFILVSTRSCYHFHIPCWLWDKTFGTWLAAVKAVLGFLHPSFGNMESSYATTRPTASEVMQNCYLKDSLAFISPGCQKVFDSVVMQKLGMNEYEVAVTSIWRSAVMSARVFAV